MGSIYLLTLRQLSGRIRLLIMTVLSSLPVLIAVASGTSQAPDREFEAAVLSVMLAGSISPLVVLAAASVAFGHEVEDRTLANLTLAPIARWKIVVSKLLATISVAGPFIGLSALATAYVGYGGDVVATVAVTVSALVGVALYAAAFLWLGLTTKQAIGFGLLYIVLWEGFFSGFVSGVRVLSIRHFSISLAHGIDERLFAWTDTLDFAVAAAISVALTLGLVGLTVRSLRRMDVP